MSHKRKRVQRSPICFGVCLEKYVPHRFWHNYFRIKRLPQDIEYSVSMARTDRARNQIAEHFLNETKCTHLLYLDSDQIFDPDIVEKLLKWKVPVVGCLYFQRDPEKPIPHMYRWNPDMLSETGDPSMDSILDWTDGLVKCDVVGTGGMMIARWVLEKIPSPWFEYGGLTESEDVTFCRKLAQADIPVYCDTTCESGHLGETVVGRTQFLFWKAVRDKKLDMNFLKGD